MLLRFPLMGKGVPLFLTHFSVLPKLSITYQINQPSKSGCKKNILSGSSSTPKEQCFTKLTSEQQRLPRPLDQPRAFRQHSRDGRLVQVSGQSWGLHADQVASDTVHDGLEDFVASVPVHCLVEHYAANTGIYDDVEDYMVENRLEATWSGISLNCY